MPRAARIIGKLFKFLGYLVGGVIGFVLLLLVALNFLLDSEWFMRIALDTALPPVEKAICAKIEVQKFRLRLLPFRLEITGAKYTDPTEKYGKPFARLEHLLIKAKTLPLLRGQVVVSEIAIEGAENYLYINDGVENLPICPSPPKPKKPPGPVFRLKLPIVAERVTVDAKFAMDIPATKPPATEDNPDPRPSTPLHIGVDTVHVEAHADLNSGDSDAAVRIAGVDFRLGDSLAEQVQTLAIDARCNLQNWDAQVPRIELALPDLTLHGTAKAEDLLDDLETTAHLEVESDLRKVNQVVLNKPGDLQLRGPFDLVVDGGVRLTGDAVSYWGKGGLAIKEGAVNQLPVRNFQTDFSVDEDQAEVSALHVETAGGEARVSAHLTFSDTLPVIADVKLAGVNVGEALRQFGLKNIPVAGVVGADLSAAGDLTPFKMNARGDVRLQEAGYADQVRVKTAAINLDATTDIGRAGGAAAVNNEIRQLTIVANEIEAVGVELPTATVSLKGAVHSDAARIDSLTVATAHTNIAAHGTAAFAGRANVQATAEFADLAEFKGLAGKETGGHGRVDATIGGALKNPTIAGRLEFADLLFDQAKLASLTADVGLENKRATVTGLAAKTATTTLRLDGAYDMKPAEPLVEARISLPETPIAELLKMAGLEKKFPLTGRASLTADVNGPVEHLNGAVAFKAADLAAYDEQVKAVNLAARLQNGDVQIDDLSLEKARGIRPTIEYGVWKSRPDEKATAAEKEPASLTVTGVVNPFAKTFNVKLRTKNLTEMASDYIAKNHIPAMADVDLNADLNGTFANPAGELTLAVAGGRYQDMNFGNSTIAIKFQNEQAIVTGELLAARRAEAAGQPAAPAAPAPPKTAPTDDDDNDDAAAADDDDDDAAAGDDDDDQSPPDADFGPGAAKPPAAQPAAPKPGGNLGSIKIAGTLGLAGDMPFTAKLIFDKVDYSDFLNTPSRISRRVKTRSRRRPVRQAANATAEDVLRGYLDGAAEVAGSLHPPAAGADDKTTSGLVQTMDLRLAEVLFQQNQFQVRNQNEAGRLTPVEIHYAGGKLTVGSFALGGAGIRLHVTDKQVGGEPYLALAGDVDVSIAAAFVPALAEAAGKLKLQAEIPVAFDLDKITADAAIVNGTVVIQNVPSPIENLNFAARFEKRVATIQKLTAAFGGGVVQGGGTYKLASVAAAAPQAPAGEASPEPEAAGPAAAVGKKQKPHDQADLFFKATKIHTGYDPYLDVTINKVDLLVTTRHDGKLDVSGDADITRATVTYDIDLPQILKMLQAPRSGATGSAIFQKEREPAVYFSVGIRGDRGLSFENNVAQIESKADLLLSGNNLETGLIGTVEVIKGHALVWNNDYAVTNAAIQFIDESRIAPVFDINARTDVKDIKIYVNVSGTPENYTVALSSDPPHNEQDIVALLTVGVSVSEFQASGSNVNSDQVLAAAAQQLLGSQFSTYTGLDLSVDNSTGTPFFKASKTVAKNLSVSLLRSVSDPTLKTMVNYDFLGIWGVYADWSNFADQADAPASGGYGAGVQLKIPFR